MRRAPPPPPDLSPRRQPRGTSHARSRASASRSSAASSARDGGSRASGRHHGVGTNIPGDRPGSAGADMSSLARFRGELRAKGRGGVRHPPMPSTASDQGPGAGSRGRAAPRLGEGDDVGSGGGGADTPRSSFQARFGGVERRWSPAVGRVGFGAGAGAGAGSGGKDAWSGHDTGSGSPQRGEGGDVSASRARSTAVARLLAEAAALQEDIAAREEGLIEALRMAGLKRGQVCRLCVWRAGGGREGESGMCVACG